MRNKIIGIYAIINRINGKYYIGSSKDILGRWTTHVRDLKNGVHHSVYLQRSWNIHTAEDFILIILKICNNESDLFGQETRFIELMLPDYNVGSVGGGDNISNHPNLDDIRHKQSISGKQRYINMTQEEKLAHSNKFKGEKNPNWRGGISSPVCHCGNKMSPHRKQCRKCDLANRFGKNNSFHGKKHSQETKDKIRQSNLGRKPPNSHKVMIDGIIYASKSDAAKALGVSAGLISYRFKKKHPGYEIYHGATLPNSQNAA